MTDVTRTRQRPPRLIWLSGRDPQPDILGWSGSSEAHTKVGDIGPSSPTVMSLWLTAS
jgi:hypothetical protein